jgi:hypothetical protein
MTKTPKTLAEAHDLVLTLRPPVGAPASAWLQFRLHAARIYTEVADIDRHHHHEATYWAAFEREKANAIRQDLTDADDTGPQVQ